VSDLSPGYSFLVWDVLISHRSALMSTGSDRGFAGRWSDPGVRHRALGVRLRVRATRPVETDRAVGSAPVLRLEEGAEC